MIGDDNADTVDAEEEDVGETGRPSSGRSPRRKKKRTRRERALARRGVLGEQLLDSSSAGGADVAADGTHACLERACLCVEWWVDTWEINSK